MPINLGNWSWAANLALSYGAPALAAAFGVPGPVSAFAINALKGALGLKQSAPVEEVRAAADADPDAAKEAFQAAQSEVVAKYEHLTAVAQIQGKVNETNVVEVNKTIRAELGKVSWYHWRHLLGFVPVLLGVEVATLLPLIVFGKISAGDMGAILTAITPVLAIFAGLLGYVAQDTTSGKVAAATGQPVPGILSTAIKGITGSGKK